MGLLEEFVQLYFIFKWGKGLQLIGDNHTAAYGVLHAIAGDP